MGPPSLLCVDGWWRPSKDNINPSEVVVAQGPGGPLVRLYTRICANMKCKCNSEVMAYFDSLPYSEQIALTELDLGRNYMGKQGIYAVIELVKIHTVLEKLSLANNELELEHVEALVEMCVYHNRLRCLDLSGNPITVVAARHLVSLLQRNPRITEIKVDGTDIDDEWKERLSKYCQSNVVKSSKLNNGQSQRLSSAGSRKSRVPLIRQVGEWKCARVFISSTQSDAQAELNILQNLIFPKLNELSNSLYVRFIPVILPWDASKPPSLDIMKASLDAIDSCRESTNHFLPWMIILAGDKIGPIVDPMPDKLMFQNPERYSWLDAPDVGHVVNMSLTQMEAWHGFVHQRWKGTMSPSAHITPTVFVYFRDQVMMKTCLPPKDYLPYQFEHEDKSLELPPPKIGYPIVKKTFKQRRNDLFDLMKAAPGVKHMSYTPVVSDEGMQGLEGFVVRVCTDLWSAAKELYGEVKNEEGSLYTTTKLLRPSAEVFFPTCIHRYTAWQQSIYIKHKTSPLFIGRQIPLKALRDYCAWGGKSTDSAFPTVVYGPTGVGKSTLLAQFCKGHVPSDAILIQYFVGASKNSRYISDVLFQLYMMIFEALNEQGLVSKHDIGDLRKLPSLLAALLQKPSTSLMVVVVDGIDQIEYEPHPSGEYTNPNIPQESLSWIPYSLPPNLRLILSSNNNSQVLRQLRQRVPQPLEVLVGPLPACDALDILRTSLGTWALPGLEPSDGLSQVVEDKVVDEPTTIAGSIMYKDDASLPLYQSWLAVLISGARQFFSTMDPQYNVSQAMAYIKDVVPDSIDLLFELLLSMWEEIHGLDVVAHTMAMLAVSKDGLSEDEILAMFQSVLQWNDPEARHHFHHFFTAIAPFVWRAPSGLLTLTQPQSCLPVIHRRYGLDSAKRGAYHSALAQYFRTVVADRSYNYTRGLEELPGHLIRAGALDAAYKVLMNIVFMELKMQSGLFWQLMRDFELMRQGVEWSRIADQEEGPIPKAGDHTFHRLHHFLSHGPGHLLGSYADLLLLNANQLAHYPSICQLACNLPDGHPLNVEVQGMIETNQVPYPLLLHTNKCTPDVQSIKVLEGHESGIMHTDYSPDGKMLASTSEDGQVRIWDVKTGKCLHVLQYFDPDPNSPSPKWVAALFKKDGSFLITCGHEQVTWWDPLTGEQGPTLARHVIALKDGCLSPGGKTIVAVGLDDGQIAIVDAVKGKKLATLDHPDPDWVWVNEVVYADESNVMACYLNGVVITDGKDPVTYSAEGCIPTQTILSPTGQCVATIFSTKIHLWAPKTGETLQILDGHTDVVNCIGFSNDGQRLVSGSDDGTVRVWRVEDGSEIDCFLGDPTSGVDEDDNRITRLHRHPESSSTSPKSIGIGSHPIHRVAQCGFSPRADYIVASCGKSIRLWDSSTHRLYDTLNGHQDLIRSLSMSEAHNLLTTGSADFSIRVWNMDKPIPSPNKPTNTICVSSWAHRTAIKSIDVSSDRAKMVTTSMDGEIKVWDIQDEMGPCLLSTSGGFHNAKFFKSSDSIITGRMDNLVMLAVSQLHAQVWACPIIGPTHVVDGGDHSQVSCRLLAVAPKGKSVAFVVSTASGELANKVTVLNGQSLPARYEIQTFRTKTRITSIQYASEDIIVVGSVDNQVRLFEVYKNITIPILATFAAPVSCLATSNDGKFFVAGSHDSTLKVVDLTCEPTAELATIVGHVGRIKCCAVSQSRQYIASGSDDGTIKIWDRLSSKCAASYVCNTCPVGMTFTRPAVAALEATPEILLAADDQGHVYIFDVLD